MRRALLLLVAVLGVAGCVRLRVPAPEIRDYRLDYPPPRIDGTPLPIVLRIPSMDVAAIYDRQSIVFRDGRYSTGAYFDSRWSANPGSMLADLLARDFAASGLYRAIQQAPSILPADDQLNGYVEEIEERVNGQSCVAHLAFRVLLMDMRQANNPILLQQRYAGDEPSTCDRPEALAAAMSRIMAKLSEAVQRDVYQALSGRTASAH